MTCCRGEGRSESPQNEKKSLGSLPLAALEAELAALGQPAYRAAQLFGWLHQKQATAFADMTNLPAALRARLEADYTIDVPTVVRHQRSADGTEKLLLQLNDGHCIEAVLMHYHHGTTLCVSSQVGCRMGCRFCASAAAGLVRNLSAGEMAAQLYVAQRLCTQRIHHVVLMGMGEPLDNFDAVVDFIAIVTHAAGADLSVRNISLSTCGLVPAIRRLAKLRLGLTLSVSLHAATNAQRSALMPVNDAYPLQVLMAACKDYRRATGRRVSFEYTLARGQNDAEADALALQALLAGQDAHVNLIPTNPVRGTSFLPSDAAAVEAFAALLRQKGVNATVRRRLGADIDAACGQLRLRHLAEEDGGHQNEQNA
ncbi:MAG: 23S rRNA (adenine(2503)-C(2))-methyltransferase RlmN [Oscillospiraceae bacterium]